MHKQSVVIIGAGISGIAAAIRLAVKGFSVTIFETNDFAGGKLSEIRLGDYRFDAGPSLLTLPHLVDELFELAGREPEAYFRYCQLDNICRYFYPDGLIINAWQDTGLFAAELEEKTGTPANRVKRFLDRSASLYKLTAPLFLFSPFHRWQTLVSADLHKAALNFWKLDAFRTMHTANSKWFTDARVVQLFDRYATYNGSDPYQAPATLNVIPHLEHNNGAFFPKYGMYSIVTSLLGLAGDLGVTIHYKAGVEEIICENNKIWGVKVTGHRIKADYVVSAIDIASLNRLLVKPLLKPSYLNQPRSTSALIFYWAVNRTFPQLELHNIFFTGNYQDEFHHLFHTKTLTIDPTIYIFISSKMVKGDAPEGCENWFVMINTPENCGQDWDTLIAEARKAIVRKINLQLGITIEEHIEAEAHLDPRSIESRTGSLTGALYGANSNNMFAAFRRHPNFSRRVKGLYFTGGSVHPGGGIPLCLASAKITTELIVESIE